MGTRIIKTSYSDDISKKDLDVSQSQETNNKLDTITNNKVKETMNVVVTDNVNGSQKRLTPKGELKPTLRNKVMIKKEDAFTSNLIEFAHSIFKSTL